MGTIKLGARPKSFLKLVRIPLLDGGVGTVEMRFKYRTRSEYGDWVDAFLRKAGAVAAAEQADDETAPEGTSEVAEGDSADVRAEAAVVKPFSMREHLEGSTSAMTEQILDAADGWNLGMPFDREHVEQMLEEVPGSGTSILSAYRAALIEGRLGN